MANNQLLQVEPSAMSTVSAAQLQQPLPPSPESIALSETKMPEPQVPIRKYYGRKRDDQSSSDEELSVDEDGDAAK